VRIDGLNVLFLAGVTALAGASAACGDFIRQDRAPVTLVIDRLEAASGESTTFGGTLQSDVLTNGGIISDSGRVTMRLIPKDVGTAPSTTNGVTITRYRVTFRRNDGRNTPGVDVPFPFDSAVTFSVPPSGIVTHSFELIRHVAKLESPLAALAQSIGLIVSTVADVTFFGRDQAGNELSVTASIGVQFGNFADPEN
jgi:hypothetical protein